MAPFAICTSSHAVGSRVGMEVRRRVFGERGTEPQLVDAEHRPVVALVEVVESQPFVVDSAAGMKRRDRLRFALLRVTNGKVTRDMGRLPIETDVHEMGNAPGGDYCLPSGGRAYVTLRDSVPLSPAK